MAARRVFAQIAASTLLAVVFFGASSSQSFAQYPFVFGGGTAYHHASTLEEGAARGMADLVRSAGAANLLNSEAAKNYEEARSMYFDNRLKGTQTYFEMREVNRQSRQAMAGQRATSEQLFRLAKARVPEALSPDQLDPYSGEIRWPGLLMTEDYVDGRTTIDDLIKQRAADPGGVTAEDQDALHAALHQLTARLKENISSYRPNDYLEAKNFLQGLAMTTGIGLL